MKRTIVRVTAAAVCAAFGFFITAATMNSMSTDPKTDVTVGLIIAIALAVASWFGFKRYIMPELVAQVSLGATQRASFVGEPSSGSFAARPKQQERIFIIHGHDEGARNEVAAFLAQLGLRPVVLRDLPNKGRTIIEKVGDYANVGFAIAILTPDDVGKQADDHQGALQSRARQNVIFEMGFFIGVLGRAKVCALVKGNL